ncbi:MAG: replication-associated recombination protein A, partial [Myxococcota bacterium]
QQDALLPHVERGVVTLLGATTENPSFEVNGALLSRCRVVVVKPLDESALHTLLERALTDRERGLGARGLAVDDEARAALVTLAGGDGRRLLTTLEICADLLGGSPTKHIDIEHVQQAAGRRAPTSDKKGDKHYGVISAFIKSLRGSDPDAACYYLVRMLEAGEDPYFLLRRMVIFASEDVGNADPRALQVATAALHAFELVGLPEGVLPLTQAATFLATCPKSNAVYAAYNAARADVARWPDEPVPPHLVNAVTALQKQQGTGDGYLYPHDFDESFVAQQYAPDRLVGRVYYAPKGAGLEKTILERMQRWRHLRGDAVDENGRRT